jgi:hypothetical protein
MKVIMSKLIRDVVMHWIYIKVWLIAKPFFIFITGLELFAFVLGKIALQIDIRASCVTEQPVVAKSRASALAKPLVEKR